nr:PREDICTED: chitobiosyldiphosphodolichol beta-mannosyltransferase-like [Linepithema humile]
MLQSWMWIVWNVLFFIISWIVCKLCLKLHNRSKKSVCVVVLGDIGRSPRMQYHAISFAREGFIVDIIGYPGSPPMKKIMENKLIRIHYLRSPPELLKDLPRLLYYMIKVIWQVNNVCITLAGVPLSESLIIQNPPTIPTIPICWLYCILTRTQFIIDWHNYGHSLMALSLGENHTLVKLAKMIEITFGRRANNNFCVSNAMKEDLEKKWAIQAKVLYDKPTEGFHPISKKDKAEFLIKLVQEYNLFPCSCKQTGLIVSSTSWTEDEDFSILLNALQAYENARENNELNLPDLICIITGKGLLKDFYMAIVNLKQWKHIKVESLWLENEDYPKMLACADLGVCLHTSSSGLDLPMKIVDMFGCRLPVCAYNFNCLSELVQHNENSWVFTNEVELAQQLKMWFQDFPNSETQQQLRKKFQKNMCKLQDWHAVTIERNLNNRPIIGVLTQEINYNLNKKYPNQYHSYIAASYIKFIEGAGAQPVPIWIDGSNSYYENILSKINGVLWPGGSTFFFQRKGYADAGAAIYRIAKRINEEGDYFPIFGICLGFELLTYVAANRIEHRTNCSSKNQPLPLEFKSNYRKSKLFKNAPRDVLQILSTENVTANYHQFCVTEEDLRRVNLDNEFRVMSVNRDKKGLEFISSLEHKSFPFYGVQFHPEKNLYEWITGKNIPHGSNATRVSQYFADFFVNEARKNSHHFVSTQKEKESSIYNYPVTYTALKNSSFTQCYMFKKSDRNFLIENDV